MHFMLAFWSIEDLFVNVPVEFISSWVSDVLQSLSEGFVYERKQKDKNSNFQKGYLFHSKYFVLKLRTKWFLFL